VLALLASLMIYWCSADEPRWGGGSDCGVKQSLRDLKETIEQTVASTTALCEQQEELAQETTRFFRSQLTTSKTFSIITKSGQYVALTDDSDGPTTVSLTTSVKQALKFVAIIPCLASATINDSDCVSFMAVGNKVGWILRHYNYDLWLETQVNPRNDNLINVDGSFHVIADKFFPGFFSLESVNYPGYYVEKDETSARGLYIHLEDGSGSISYEESSFLFLED